MTNLPPPLAETLDRRELPRFGLRTLFVGVSLICFALAVFVGGGPLLAAGLSLGGLVLVAHLAAAFIGHRMLHRATTNLSRAHAKTVIRDGQGPAEPASAAFSARPAPRPPSSEIVQMRD